MRAAARWLRRSLPPIVAVLAVAGLVTGVVFGHHFVTSSAQFELTSITLSGHRVLSEQRVRDVLGLPAGELGPNLFELDLAAMEQTLEEDPWVVDAIIERRLPSTLAIEVDEHQPVMLVEMDGMYLADRTGEVFARAVLERGDGRGLPVVSGIARERYRRDPEAARAAIRRGLVAAELYTDSDDSERGAASAASRPRLGEVHLDPHRGVTFFTHDTAMAVRVGHGSPEILGARLAAFDAAWQALSARERDLVRVVYADADSRPDRVTVGFATAAD